MKVGRVVGTAVLGLFLFLFIAIDLVLFGVIAFDSVLVSLIPLIGLVVGGVLGAMASQRASARNDVSAAVNVVTTSQPA